MNTRERKITKFKNARKRLFGKCECDDPRHILDDSETLIGNPNCFPVSISIRAMDHSEELQQRASEIIPMYLKTAEQWSI